MLSCAPDFLVRFPDPSAAAQTVGVGFVVDSQRVLTCAHVVNAALGRDHLSQEQPGEQDIVTLRLPIRDDGLREAQVERWVPPPTHGVAGGDIAGLVVIGEGLPDDLVAARLTDDPPPNRKVQLFGYPSEVHRPLGGWVPGVLRNRIGGDLLQIDSDEGAAWRAQPGYSGTPVITPGSLTVLGMFKAASPDDDYRDSYAIPSTMLREAWEDVLGVLPPSPYKRLAAFDERDSHLFFGRKADTERLLAAVGKSSLLVVIGPSGVGKSSLVQAGLVPALRASGEWVNARFRPGSDPFRTLAVALLQAEGAQTTLENLRQRADDVRGGGLVRLLSDLHVATNRRLLLVLDQMEELFGPELTPSLVAQFVEEILTLTGAEGHGTTLVATMRADFYGRLLQLPEVAPRLDGRVVPLSPLGTAGLRRVVAEPAESRGVGFATGLVDRIVRDAGSEAGALPLVEFTLDELWSRQRKRLVTHEAYEEIGRLDGALRSEADRVIAGLVGRGIGELAIHRALLGLVSRTAATLPGTKRTCRTDQLASEEKAVIDALVGTRLATTDRDTAGHPTAELAHEFLITAWPRLTELVEEEGAFVRWRSEVEQWIGNGYGLLPDAMVAEARRWCDERPEDTAFAIRLVEHSEAEQQRRTRELELARDEARAAARRVEALRLAAQAELAGRRTTGLTAMLALSAASLHVEHRLEGDQAARRALSAAAFPVSQLLHDGPVLAVGFSPDGRWVVTGSSDGTARVFDPATGQERSRLTHDREVWSVGFSPDGRWVATGSDDGTARIFDPATGQEHSRLPHDDMVWSVGFSPDGRWVATASSDGTARIFDPATGQERSRLTHHRSVRSVGFSPDGRWVVTGSDDGTARVSPIAAELLVTALEAHLPRELTEAEWERCGGRPTCG